MEGLQKFVKGIAKESKLGTSSDIPCSFRGNTGVTAAVSSSDQSGLLVNRLPRQAVSISTCSKLCAFFFVAGVVVGYTLKKRVRKWVSKLLKRLKDD